MQRSSGLECPICLERFTDPKVLPCQHTFCRNCLQEFIQSNANQAYVHFYLLLIYKIMFHQCLTFSLYAFEFVVVQYNFKVDVFILMFLLTLYT